MLTSALAMLFQQNGHKIVAVDCDIDAPNLALWLNEIGNWDKVKKISTSEKPTIDHKKCTGCGTCVQNCRFQALRIKKNKSQLIPYNCEGCGVCEIVCPQGAIKLRPVKNGEIRAKSTKYGFALISGQLYPGETGSGKIVSEVKKEAQKRMGDVMLIDSAPGTGCPVIASLQDADYVILITEPTPSGLSDLCRVLEVVKHFKVPFGVVVNKWDINKEMNKTIVQKFQKRILGTISYDQKIFKAISKLDPILETELKAKREITKIYSNLTKLSL